MTSQKITKSVSWRNLSFDTEQEESNMSKYDTLWEYIQESAKSQLTLTYDEVRKIAGVPLDHSFLKYKKELLSYGYEVKKISMKAQTVLFVKKEQT